MDWMNQDQMYRYPTLFHKYLLGLSKVGPPNYEVIRDLIPSLSVDCICHFHIFNLDRFVEFKDKIELILARMPVIITYSLGSIESITVENFNLGVLKIPNRGYDIGAKMCCLDYLKRQEIQFEYILMLHSKSNLERRRQYFDPFIKSGHRLDLICELLQMKQTNLLGIFPNVMWYDHQGQKNYPRDDVYQYDWYYYREIMAYLECTNSDKIFAEGNVMILHRSVIDFVWGSNLDLFYQILNSDNSFDWNWFKIQYPQHQSKSLHEAYWFYKVHHLWGNNTPIISKQGSNAGAMIEHIFERIWINVILHLGGRYLVLGETNLMDIYKIKIRVNTFSKLNSDQASPVIELGLQTQLRLRIKSITFENFDFEYYLDCNPDVKTHMGKNYQQVYEHFLIFGVPEKRPARFFDPHPFVQTISHEELIQDKIHFDPNQHPPIISSKNSDLEVDFSFGLNKHDPVSFNKMLYRLLCTILLHHTCDWGVIIPLNHLIVITGKDSREEFLYLEILNEISCSI